MNFKELVGLIGVALALTIVILSPVTLASDPWPEPDFASDWKGGWNWGIYCEVYGYYPPTPFARYYYYTYHYAYRGASFGVWVIGNLKFEYDNGPYYGTIYTSGDSASYASPSGIYIFAYTAAESSFRSCWGAEWSASVRVIILARR